MSDLDKAIRARLQLIRVHMGEHRNAQFDDGVDPLFNDAGELSAAVVAVLDLHAPQALYPLVPDDVRCAGCSNHVVRVDYPCATVTAIASSLGVSGGDRSEPTPAPRTWPVGSPEPQEPGLTVVDGNGTRFRRDPHGQWKALHPAAADRSWNWFSINGGAGFAGRALTEVVSPEGTS